MLMNLTLLVLTYLYKNMDVLYTYETTKFSFPEIGLCDVIVLEAPNICLMMLQDIPDVHIFSGWDEFLHRYPLLSV